MSDGLFILIYFAVCAFLSYYLFKALIKKSTYSNEKSLLPEENQKINIDEEIELEKVKNCTWNTYRSIIDFETGMDYLFRKYNFFHKYNLSPFSDTGFMILFLAVNFKFPELKKPLPEKVKKEKLKKLNIFLQEYAFKNGFSKFPQMVKINENFCSSVIKYILKKNNP